MWQPLLTDELAADAHEAVRELAEALRGLAPRLAEQGFPRSLRDLCFSSGHAGLAVTFGYLEQTGLWPGLAGTSDRLLAETIDGAAEIALSPSFYYGYTGIAWTAQMLTRADDADANEDVDEVVLEALRELPASCAPHDLMLGVLGTGVYALERLDRPLGREILEELIGLLDRTAERSAAGISWRTMPVQTPASDIVQFPDGYNLFGVSHGIAGVISVLASVWAAGVARERIEPLLSGAVEWLLSYRLPAGEAASFAIAVETLGHQPVPAPFAWCHGEPGITAALLTAARCTGEETWERTAVELALRAAERRAPGKSLQEVCLCHGSAGWGHLFNRMFQATGEERLGQAARSWLAQALRLREKGKGLGGYTAERLPADEVSGAAYEIASAAPGLLMGAGGVAAALAAALSPVEPWWDRALLISPAGPAAQPA